MLICRRCAKKPMASVHDGRCAPARSLYSTQLKAALGYSQTQVEGLASPLIALLVVGWLPGVAYDALRSRRRLGPRCCLLPAGEAPAPRIRTPCSPRMLRMPAPARPCR
jgi:hypothetical protein